jgi:hypothetical protein
MNSIATGFHRQTVANDHGVYEFQSLPVGSYQIPISKSGFEPFVISRVDVLVGQVRTLDAKLPSALRSVISSTPIPASYRMFLFGSGYAGLGLTDATSKANWSGSAIAVAGNAIGSGRHNIPRQVKAPCRSLRRHRHSR